jgi:hypothetical protein
MLLSIFEMANGLSPRCSIKMKNMNQLPMLNRNWTIRGADMERILRKISQEGFI